MWERGYVKSFHRPTPSMTAIIHSRCAFWQYIPILGIEAPPAAQNGPPDIDVSITDALHEMPSNRIVRFGKVDGVSFRLVTCQSRWMWDSKSISDLQHPVRGLCGSSSMPFVRAVARHNIRYNQRSGNLRERQANPIARPSRGVHDCEQILSNKTRWRPVARRFLSTLH